MTFRVASIHSKFAPAGRLWQAFLALLFLGVLAACSGGEPKAVLHTAKGDFAFNVEIADTPASQQRGLMFRDSLAPDAGMLFVFPKEEQHSFWMQNTFIPLDIIFVDASGAVRTIQANARPKDTTAIPSVVPVQFVFEIAGGRAAEIGLTEGDLLTHPLIGVKN